MMQTCDDGLPGAPSVNPLAGDVRFVRGVGHERAVLLGRLGIRTVEDLLFHLPREVLDLTDVRPVPNLESDKLQSVRGNVVDIDGRSLTRGRTMVAVLLDCDGHYLRGVWFNQRWMLERFSNGDHVLFSGKPKRRGGRWEIAHPKVQWLDRDTDADHVSGGVQPKYGLTEGLKQHELRRFVREAVDLAIEFVADCLPDELREELDLPVLRDAVRMVHSAATPGEYEAARYRIVFDDLLEFQLGLVLRRRAWRQSGAAPILPTTARIDSRIRRLFPFRFTDGQNSAVNDIVADLASGRAMHRLLQADVGAGKTSVAVYAMLVAIAAGHQAVLMAPTEVLANQHWDTIDRLLIHSRVDRVCLTGSLSQKQRRETLDAVHAGRVQLIVGTQAVIQQDVEFENPGIVVIDEQHKFGVQQRARFSAGDRQPHVLVMTATPIPRSLCLTQFGDLDLSVIRDMPPGRQPVVTGHIIGQAARGRAWDFIRKQIQSGRQAYVVCPRIGSMEDSSNDSPDADSDLDAAQRTYHDLRDGELREFRMGLVHGRMDRAERADQMVRFRDGDLQVLVSTTVIEVGVDVPNATLIVIRQADRFGLSQLHQLRGRIGRGRHRGYCFLFSDSASQEATERLAVLERTCDGFEIAEADFEMRGPGDVLGVRQHGQLPLRVANPVRDRDALVRAREVAVKLVESGRFDQPDYAPLRLRVFDRFGRLMNLPKSG